MSDLIDRYKQWRRDRRLIRVYRGMRNIAEDHRAAGHKPEFHAINESWLVLKCPGCPFYEQNILYEEYYRD